MNRIVSVAAFVVGLGAVVWVGRGYVASPLALTMTALIGAVYVAGALELLAFQRATAALVRRLAAVPPDLSHPGDWLRLLPPSLQTPVRLRLEGERVGLPGPALTPYLVGLLVLLGMLGTFLGMVVTLKGAVLALETTTDLQTIRAALAAPVKGLGFAFGTSVAGAAASATLGLVSALCRRARLQAAQRLDTTIATTLRGFSRAHERQATLEALQVQAQALPAVVNTLQAMMARMERQSRARDERLLAEQERFYRDATGTYADLARAVDRSLKESLTESARLAGATIQPVVAATMTGMARETTALQELVAETVERQLVGIAERFATSVTRVADTWTAALTSHERTSENVSRHLQAALAAHTDTFAQRSAALLAAVDGAHVALRTELAATTTGLAQEAAARHARLADTVATQLDGLAGRFGTAVTTVAGTWTTALATHERVSAHLTGEIRASLDAFTDTFAQRSAALLATIGERAAARQTELAATDEARLAALTRALGAMAAALQQEWQQAGARTLAHQEQICHTLAATGRDLSAAAHAQASSTITEVARLVQTAAAAPGAAAEVIGQMRQELSASVARDNELLAERSRMMETLGTLLAAINHASTEQRQAIEALVGSSTALLERSATRFAADLEAQSATIAAAAGQITGGAVEVASLGEAFGLAVQLFGESNDKLAAALARIEGALDKSMARSDEQLAYYVAQAREIVDLTIMSQQQIIGDLQQRSGTPAAVTGEV
ncbi:MAG TPA: DUF802 domain-containing protein [Polyangia bacterium]|jgi:hypothetical protein